MAPTSRELSPSRALRRMPSLQASPIGDESMKTKRKKAAAIVCGVTGVLAVLLGTVYAADTLFDHHKSERFTISEPVRKVVVASHAGNVEVTATSTKRVIVHRTTDWVTTEPTA